ncbi:tRNA pseudouridine(38-40) synthase TruA [Psychrobium sp. 1_MG-2023]|uniref:tRNA pseudouridine(38-40) synthase TruA n=1 Tax=Psychrobium sp. 1_MG-2023 TaxID=3062624 RepID=UPI000C31C421|nr:tRNA pseudouridine(38-40) synthase TruA [Psychrobium sp. 1_MG-2023]MDP2561751.1 tRNA pseudouridine(38-40) synthase TruA [Psychrobium sp. 1_MG-2023]PKF59793.1 tRNA pseudouridine(38-40) synthase TruA [Alteromonadales bacterium alter-6D02]
MRIALGVEYNGSAYYGWQRQKDVISVQSVVEKALTTIANEPITVQCAGRTDCGVHATGQVVHFDTTAERSERGWTLGVNAKLPSDVAIRWAKIVDDEFHARFSATGRRYRYIICNTALRPAILSEGLSHYYQPLDETLMHEASRCLVGTHDFTAYRALHCQAHSAVREVKHLEITRQGQFIVIDIKANGFLHHMVRNIVGMLIKVGEGSLPPKVAQEILDGKDRAKAPAMAKAGGLYLVEVDYPESFGLPRPPCGPLFLTD